MMRRRLLISTASSSAIAAAFAALSAGGCTPVGDGTGAASGPLWIHGCQDGHDLGTIEAPHDYDLLPTFFAGEPIGHISEPPVNRLIIRMQRNGNAVQINDMLYVDIPDSFKVAQCLRGSTAPGRAALGHGHRHDQSPRRRCPSRRRGASRPDRPAFRASTSSRSARCAYRSRRSIPVTRTASGRRSSPSRAWRRTAGSTSSSSAAPRSQRTVARHARAGRQRLPGELRRPPAREFPRRAGGRPRADGASTTSGCRRRRTSAARSTASSTSISSAAGRGRRSRRSRRRVQRPGQRRSRVAGARRRRRRPAAGRRGRARGGRRARHLRAAGRARRARAGAHRAGEGEGRVGRADRDRAAGAGPGAAAVSAVRHLRRLPVATRDAGGAARGQAGDRRARASACRCRTSSRRARRSAIGSAPSWRSARAGRSAFGRGGRTTSSTSRRVRCSAIRAGARAAGAARDRARAGGRRRDRRAGGQRRRPRQRRPRRFDQRGARAAGD